MNFIQRREVKLLGLTFVGLLLFLWLQGSWTLDATNTDTLRENKQYMHVEIARLRERSESQDLKLASTALHLRSLRNVLGDLICKNADYVSPSGGWCLQPAEPSRGVLPNGVKVPMHHVVADPGLVDPFADLFDGHSVLDLGAGVGQYESEWKHRGRKIEATAYDGALNVEEYTNGTVQWTDLTIPLALGRNYDWVFSLEVGEHIPKRSESVYLDNLDLHNRCGILLSWAIPGQGGHSHVNEKSNEEIIAEFVRRNYRYDERRSIQFRKQSTYSWFANTIMVFHRPAGNCK